jgi:hypothetical protein
VYPCSAHTKAGCFKGAQAAATCDLDQIGQWADRHKNCNWRVVFGKSSLWGLDVDSLATHDHDGIASMAALVQAHGPLPVGPRARSGGGGVGLYFRHQDEKIVGSNDKLGPAFAGIDPKRGPLTQTIPPSIHIGTRRPYRWIVPPWEAAPPPGPAWLLALLEPAPPPPPRPSPALSNGTRRRNYAVAALHNATREVASARDGIRNSTLNRCCWSVSKYIQADGLAESEVRSCMMAAARAALIPPDEALKTIESAIRSRCRP